MKILIFLLCLFALNVISDYVIINNTIYKIPNYKIDKLKQKYGIRNDDLLVLNFAEDSCMTSYVEWIKSDVIEKSTIADLKEYTVENSPLFLIEGKFVDIKHVLPADIISINKLSLEEAISLFGCKGLNPIFDIKLKEGASIKKNPVGGIMIRKR